MEMAAGPAVTHIALNTPDLEQAERFYRELLDMGVAFREAETPSGWATLPKDSGWREAEAAGIKLGLSVVSRDSFVLALEASDSPQRLSHLGLAIEPGEMDRLRQRAQALNCTVVVDRTDLVVLQDRYGVQWEVTSSAALQSSGERTGRWLDVKGGGR
jgi:catechol 2,3-dioxygenase-like lactoylglutathione lyase family enzyme